ncbi:MAG TPA: protease pro-enzyme activation domain-containing protein [Verrucomicrobiae bacterium]|nr:protease pro-enzyme activation domain-containing protein [Verrucomicrobiae bacterium]
MRTLHGHVPDVVKSLTPIENLPATNELFLAIGVPLRDPAGLDRFLADVYNPASPNYRHFLTPAEFGARFGATEADYAAVKRFALTNGFTITGETDSRLLLEVTAKVADIERAFHIHLQKFHDSKENRDFFAPDTEPTVNANLAVVDVQGLSDYWKPRPRLYRMNPTTTTPRSGSSPDGAGDYFGDDFRNAYAPGVTLTGAGQSVGLFQLDGYYPVDVQTYAQKAGGGRTNIVVQAVPVGSTNWSVGVNGGNAEVSLDIEMAMSMAPGLSKILVFEGPDSAWPNAVLSAMAASNTVKNLSSSWGWSGGPVTTTDNIYMQMAAQGQSFFNASGDSDAFTVGASSVNGVDNPNNENAPSSSPYITQVGGTTLTTGSGAVYSSETVWNWNNKGRPGVGSSGGVSSYYSIPTWQTNISMTANLGSTTQRNIPDVALTADQVYVISGGSGAGSSGWGGTSCAAPLWAGFMALANEQAMTAERSSAGLINSAIDTIGVGTNYNNCFHDITSGNNYWSNSPSQYPAVTGYDLCTGWGTPNGQNLITALAGPPEPLGILPDFSDLNTVSGLLGGPFSPSSQIITLTNYSASSLNWSINNTSTWVTISSSSGTLAGAGSTTVSVSVNSAANSLSSGSYVATIEFTNQTSGIVQSRQITLQVVDPLQLLTTGGFSAIGLLGGPFSPGTQAVVFTNMSTAAIPWSLINTCSWLSVSSSGGSIPGNSSVSVTLSTNAATASLANGSYNATLVLSNQSSHFIQSLPCSILVSSSLVQNGGFETGDFTDWTLNGDGGTFDYVTTSVSVSTGGIHPVTYTINPHSGTYFAALGETNGQAYLSQTLPTVAGQTYLLSLWLNNQLAGSSRYPNAFSVSWNGSTLYNKSNIGVLNWTNLQFLVTGANGGTVLQIGGRDDEFYLGIDDVSLTPVFPPTVSMQPTNLTVFAGSNAALIVTATGSAPLSYHWRKNGNNLANGGNISGATTNMLQLTSVTTNNSGNYSVVITNIYGAITSVVATLTVNLQQPVLALSSSENPAGYLDSLNFSANLTPTSATGGVQFYTNGIFFDSESLVSGSAASAFTPNLPRGTNLITAIYTGDADDFPSTNMLAQVVTNHPPTATPYYAGRYPGFMLKIPVSNLASNWSDVDGDTVSLAGVSISTNGVTLTNNAGTLVYCNSNNVSDEFTCTITDGWGGTNFQNVFIAIVPLPQNAIPAITGLGNNSNSGITLNLAGAAGFTYVLETATNLSAPDWLPAATNAVGTNGVWQYSASITNSPQQFYRLELVQ